MRRSVWRSADKLGGSLLQRLIINPTASLMRPLMKRIIKCWQGSMAAAALPRCSLMGSERRWPSACAPTADDKPGALDGTAFSDSKWAQRGTSRSDRRSGSWPADTRELLLVIKWIRFSNMWVANGPSGWANPTCLWTHCTSFKGADRDRETEVTTVLSLAVFGAGKSAECAAEVVSFQRPRDYRGLGERQAA